MVPTIEFKLMGEAWPAVQPYGNSKAYGSAELETSGKFTVRSHATLTLKYTAGKGKQCFLLKRL
jgi:hypothetical protein